jgi:hypothetical protein
LNSYGIGGVYVVVALILGIGAVSILLLGIEPAQLSLEEIATTDHGEEDVLVSIPATARE